MAASLEFAYQNQMKERKTFKWKSAISVWSFIGWPLSPLYWLGQSMLFTDRNRTCSKLCSEPVTCFQPSREKSEGKIAGFSVVADHRKTKIQVTSSGSRDSLLVQHQARGKEVVSSDPRWSGRGIFSQELTLCAASYSVSVPSPCYHGGHKRTPSFCQKCR